MELFLGKANGQLRVTLRSGKVSRNGRGCPGGRVGGCPSSLPGPGSPYLGSSASCSDTRTGWPGGCPGGPPRWWRWGWRRAWKPATRVAAARPPRRLAPAERRWAARCCSPWRSRPARPTAVRPSRDRAPQSLRLARAPRDAASPLARLPRLLPIPSAPPQPPCWLHRLPAAGPCPCISCSLVTPGVRLRARRMAAHPARTRHHVPTAPPCGLPGRRRRRHRTARSRSLVHRCFLSGTPHRAGPGCMGSNPRNVPARDRPVHAPDTVVQLPAPPPPTRQRPVIISIILPNSRFSFEISWKLSLTLQVLALDFCAASAGFPGTSELEGRTPRAWKDRAAPGPLFQSTRHSHFAFQGRGLNSYKVATTPPLQPHSSFRDSVTFPMHSGWVDEIQRWHAESCAEGIGELINVSSELNNGGFS